MALLDFIDVSDDEEIVVSKENDKEIVELSSDEETDEESHNDFTCGSPGQHPTTLYDGQAMFVSEGERETTESGNADEATPSSSVTEKGSLGTAVSPNCPHTPTAVSFPCTASISAKALTFEGFDTNLLKVKVKRRRKLFHTDTPWRSSRLEGKNKGKSMEELAVDLKRSRMLEEQNTSAASHNCSQSPAAVTFPGPTSISAEALTFAACDGNLLRVEAKRRRKLVRTDTHWRSPRLEDKNKGRNKSVEELAVDLKRSRMLEEQNSSTRSQKKNKLSLCTRCRMCKEPLY